MIRVTAILLFTVSLAWAQQPEEVRTRFYDFDELKLTGDRKRPTLLYSDARQRARFERMFQLKRSFLPELRRSADGSAVITPPEGG